MSGRRKGSPPVTKISPTPSAVASIALRRTQPGDLIAVTSGEANVAAELEAWCRFTRNTLVDFGDEAALAPQSARSRAGKAGRPRSCQQLDRLSSIDRPE